MKYNKFDKFCHKYDRFGIHNLMMIIAIGNLVVFLLDLSLPFAGMVEQGAVSAMFDFYWPQVLAGQVWRLFTFVMIPPASLLWILTPLIIYFYLWMGRMVQAEFGCLKFTIYYFTGMLMQIVYGIITGAPVTGDSLNMSLFLAMAMLFPDMQIRIYFVLPIKIKWLALVYAVFILISVVFTRSLLPLLPFLNFILYFGGEIVRNIRGQQKYVKNTVDFRSELRKTRNVKGYLHKCAVCGRTDTDSPQLEFRYCSLCAGYQCYCNEHIREHQHSTSGAAKDNFKGGFKD